ncbi:MAG: hypothetical protein QOJ53_1088 [Sphingomonadales bacterium]|jgi:hypothetical protein|nr:hypothetical protein [Sphingomonadales bacterium]
MHMKQLLLSACALLLASCASRPPVTAFHLSLPNVEARQGARRIWDVLGTSQPVMLYDDGRGSLNVVLVRRISLAEATSALRRHHLNPVPDLDAPSPAFLRVVECSRDQSCDTRELTRCTFEASINEAEYERHWDSFGRMILKSGYPAMASTFRNGPDGARILSIPYYDQCDRGAEQLTSAWREVALASAAAFHPID